MQQPIKELLVWMRVPGDVIFSAGALTLAWFVARLWLPARARADAAPVQGALARH